MFVRTLLRGAAVLAAAALVAAGPPAGRLTAYLDSANRDPNCPACRDFYQYANGGWLARHPIPADRSTYGVDTPLYEENQTLLRRALEGAAASAAPAGSPKQLAGAFYAACMNEAAVEAAGAAPLAADLQRIGAASTLSAVFGETARLDAAGLTSGFLSFNPQADPTDSRRTLADLAQGGLTLPDREYYLSDAAEMKKTRVALTEHAQRLFGLLGEDAATASADAAAVLRVETALAKPQYTNAQLRDVKLLTNPYTRDRLPLLGTAIDWKAWFAAHGITGNTAVNVDEPPYFRSLAAYVKGAPVADLQTYLRFRYAHAQEPYLAKAFVDDRFAFDSVLSGQKVQRPRWKRCVSSTDAHLTDLVGQLFVAEAFPPSAKVQANGMVRNLRAALRADIPKLTWMTAPTQQRALAKLDGMVQKIGYPDRWRSYAGLAATPTDYFADHAAAARVDADREWAKIGHATPRWEWGMGAQLINAQYDPTNNDITFPAAILLPPYYDAGDDEAMNYGAIGAVIGHEITHGFDDQGHLFDLNGNLKNWWSAADAKRFDARAQCIIDEFDHTTAIANIKYVGKQDSGEAIADLGGLRIAYDAFERAQAGRPRTKVAGYTPEQRFFMAYAMSWAQNQRDASARTQAQSDPHPLSKDRVNVTLRNFPPFAAAFGCGRTAAMVKPPAKVCAVW